MKVQVVQSCPTLCDLMDYKVYGLLQAMILECVAFPFSTGFFPTQASNSGIPHCRWILYQLSHKGSPRILELVAFPFSSGSSRPRNQTGVSCIAGGFFTNWAIGEAQLLIISSGVWVKSLAKTEVVLPVCHWLLSRVYFSLDTARNGCCSLAE